MIVRGSLIKKCRKFNIPVVICLTVYTKAKDNMNWKKRFKVLREMGVLVQIVDLVESLYEFISMMVGVDGEESEAFPAEQGVTQHLY